MIKPLYSIQIAYAIMFTVELIIMQNKGLIKIAAIGFGLSTVYNFIAEFLNWNETNGGKK